MATRAYTQDARARATAQTRRDVLDAAVKVFYRGDYDIPLERVASRANVSTRTILRHFDSKEGLIEAAIVDQASAVDEERSAPPGDDTEFVRLLADHYERVGDDVMRMLTAEDRYPLVRRLADNGRRQHARLVAAAFEPDLHGLNPGDRLQRLALLETVTDVYTWALLRRRSRLSRSQTEAAMLGLINHAKGVDPR